MENNYKKLHEKYMCLQAIPPTRITIKERNELQLILEELIFHPNSTEYDISQYYKPRFESIQSEIQKIKQYILEQIAMQETIIIMAQNKIDKIKTKLEEV